MSTSKKLVAGVGINDAGYDVVKFGKEEHGLSRSRKREWICPFYSAWHNMISRAYSGKHHKCYEHVTVAKEWHRFSTFKAWMEQQNWQGKALDKDLLIPGNTEYSPQACRFIPETVNRAFADFFRYRRTLNTKNSNLPDGVTPARGGYNAHVWSMRGTVRVVYSTVEEAHFAWAESKLMQARYLCRTEDVPLDVCRALLDRYQKLANSAREALFELPLAA